MSEFSPIRGGNEGCGACDDESRIKAWVASVPCLEYNCPQCGQLRGFWVYQKWGQKQAAGFTFVVTIPELLLP